MTAVRTPIPANRGAERAVVVGLSGSKRQRAAADRSLDELEGLVRAAGGVPVLRVLQERSKPDPATVLGRGKLQALRGGCEAAGADLIVFDHELSPAQLRNIEAEAGCRVLDRTQLILDIFARRARTREGKLQVELAQLEYLLPRLVGAGTALSRLGGGIGTRGPGETKLETDRRRIRQRIAALSREIDQIRRHRSHLRGRRSRGDAPVAALIGYTNAGKTTLFNLLTGQAATASDALFVTLDPLVRRVRLPDKRELLVTDTVGFIDRLPHTLVAAFRATLEEVAEADLLLHVIDASSPDRERERRAVHEVLAEVGASELPVIEVFNKRDLIDPAERDRLARDYPGAVLVSALRGTGRPALVGAIVRALSLDTRRIAAEFDDASERDRRRIRQLYRYGRVLRHVSRNGRVSIEADVPRRMLERLQLSS